ncbi:MAG TPA: ATP-binding protein, partial [Limnobacter sp.]|nr:ATP-binding protein [Limnobacter sp.]
ETVLARKDLLDLGLVTLLDNATQSQLRAGVASALQVGLHWNARQLVLQVTDAGLGIHPDLLPRLGRQLVQAHGQGMGLFLLTNLLEREGGSLGLHNLAQGVSATLILPVQPA